MILLLEDLLDPFLIFQRKKPRIMKVDTTENDENFSLV
jgi:hypothetical protein